MNVQRNDAARQAVLPEGAQWMGMRNQDILIKLGLNHAQIESLRASASAAGKDSLVLYCEQQGIADLKELLA